MGKTFYVCYNTSQDTFIKIVHDEAQWVSEIDKSYIFESRNDFTTTVATLIGIYARLGDSSIIEYLNDCVLVPIVIKSGEIVEANYDQFLHIEDLRWDTTYQI